MDVKKKLRIKVKVIGAGELEDPFRVSLPNYQMIPGTEEYDGIDKKVLKSVEVLVPADELDEKGRPSKARIRAKYKGQPRWDRDDVLEDITPTDT